MVVQGDLKTYIVGQGGAYASKVTDECTHLIANQKQYDAKGAKGEQKPSSPSRAILDYLLSFRGLGCLAFALLVLAMNAQKRAPFQYLASQFHAAV